VSDPEVGLPDVTRGRRMTDWELDHLAEFGSCEMCGGPMYAELSLDPPVGDAEPRLRLADRCLWCGWTP